MGTPPDQQHFLQHDGAVLSEGLAAQILVKQGEMGTQLAVVLTKLEAIGDHENRLRVLERFRWGVAGWAAAGGAVTGLAGYLIGHALH